MSANREKFVQALKTLHEYLESPIREPRDIAGILQGFAFTFELGWRAVQDEIAAKGYSKRGPRPALQAGLEAGLISVSDAEIWAEMIESRNLVAHAYRPEWATALIGKIRDPYLPALERPNFTLRSSGSPISDSSAD
jgi:nucleotidyltransferase substrate binding protein (TIGR01987 family)